MSEEVASTPSVVAEYGDKPSDDISEKIADMDINGISETVNQSPAEAEQDVKSDSARENGEEGFHTPEAAEEAQKENETKLDDDEIEDNPAYIPRKGRYYMHDSRGDDEEVEEEKRISRADGTWKHDRYDERWQRPKTKKQIMTRYGFDIREGDTQEEAEEKQRKRMEEKKKETEAEDAQGGLKRRPKRDVRQKPRPRTERTGEPPSKPRPVKQTTAKEEKGSTEERISHSNDTTDDGDRSQRRVNDDDDDDDVRVGQRRQIRVEHRRDRSERVDVRVVRNVRGSRGGLSGHRMERHQSAKERSERDRYRDGDSDRFKKERRGDEVGYENHRRGAMRGTVRGAAQSYGATRGQTRTITPSVRSNDARNSMYQREEVPPQRNAGYSPRALDNGGFYDARGGFAPRGGYAVRSRGAPIAHSPRGGYGDTYPTRGFTGPKRYSEQRGEILPPPPPPISVPPPIPPPQHNFTIPRQPTDVVYFDPTQQPSRQPLPPREKKIIEIVPPSN